MIVIYHALRGEILRLLDIPAQEAPANTQLGETWLETEEAVSDLTHYAVDGNLVAMPAKPSPHHVWDWVSKSWWGDLEGAQTARKILADAERIRRNLLPITYDGKFLDGDGTAQKNLSDKLAGVKERLRLGIPMEPAVMVWKDAGNAVHQWSNLQAYYDWLAGFAIALEDRGTRLYLSWWQHKLQIDALGSIAAVLDYDVTVNWES